MNPDPNENKQMVVQAQKMAEQLTELLDIERLRIQSADRKTDATLKLIETMDNADKRQYEFHIARLNSDADLNLRRHSLIKWSVVGTFSLAVLITVACGYYLFEGTQPQSAVAGHILSTIGIGVGGFGIGEGLRRVLRRLLS